MAVLTSIGLGAILLSLVKLAIAAGVLLLTISLVFLFTDMFEIIMNFALNKMAGTLDLQGTVLEFSGTAAFFAQKLQLKACLSFIMGAVFAKWLLRKIPFIRW